MKKIYSLVILTMLVFTLHAQVKIGNNPTSILSGSLLELEHRPASPKALTLPRMTGTEMNAVPTPTNGMFIYNIDSNCVCQYRTTGGWRSLCNADVAAKDSTYNPDPTYAGNEWFTHGNGGNTTPNTTAFHLDNTSLGANGHFIGTKDATNMSIGTNKRSHLFLTTANKSMFGGNVFSNEFPDAANISFMYGGRDTLTTTIGPFNTGVYSLGFGNLMKNTNYSFSMGQANKISSATTALDYNVAMGSFNTITDAKSATIHGNRNSILNTSINNIIEGSDNTITDVGALYSGIRGGFQHLIKNSPESNIYGGFQDTVSTASTSNHNNTIIGSHNSKIVTTNAAFNVADNIIMGAVNGVIDGNVAGSAIIGGTGNEITTTAGGNNFVIGTGSRITGGYGSMLFGDNCTSNFIGATVLNNWTSNPTAATANFQYTGSFIGGYNLFTNLGNTTGVALAGGGNAWTSISDRRAKNNIRDLGYGLNTLMQLQPVDYFYNGQTKRSIGFIAQDVQKLIPEATEQTTFGPEKDYLGIKYTELIPVLVKSIQEQQAQINALKEEIKHLRK